MSTRGGVKAVLDRFADWKDRYRPTITSTVVCVRESTVRRALGLKKLDPLQYRGLDIRCIGSQRWRERNEGVKA